MFLNLGTPKEILFDSSSPTSKRIYVSTEHNVLAALNARTGQIVWRKVFEPENGIINKLILNANNLLTVSGDSKIVRAWDTNKGHILWESDGLKYTDNGMEVLKNLPNILPQQHAVFLDPDNGGILLTNEKQIKMISQSDGTDIWQYSIKEQDEFAFGSFYHSEHVISLSVKLKEDQRLVVVRKLEAETGKLTEEFVVPAPWITNPLVRCSVASQYLVCLEPAKKMLAVRNCFTKTPSLFVVTPLLNLEHKNTLEIKEPSVRTLEGDEKLIEVKLNEKYVILVRVVHDATVKLLSVLLKPGLFASFALPNRNLIVAVRKDSTNKLEVATYELKQLEEANQKPLNVVHTELQNSQILDTGFPSPVKCALYMYKKKDDISFRLLLVLEDHSLSMLQSVGKSEAKVLWRREEALSSITNVQMIELPPATSASKLELLHAQFSVTTNSKCLLMFDYK